MKLITVIVPVYNEEDVLFLLYEKLNGIINSLIDYQFEILFVNDGSIDSTLDIIKSLKENDSRISYINLSRNFGKEVAMIAGFDYAKGDAVIIIDADLQHPPELIPRMINFWEEGFDDIYAKRTNREGEKWLKKYTSKKFYKILQKMTDIPILPDVGDYRLLDRRCVESLKKMRESQRYTKGMYSWIGFKKKEIEYEAAPRVAGSTKWNYFKLIDLALEGITSFTTLPLRLSSVLGFIFSIISFIYLVYITIKTIIYGSDVNGYPSLMVIILFLGGVQLISIGIIGEYLGRVFNETKNRPLYFIEEYSELGKNVSDENIYEEHCI